MSQEKLRLDVNQRPRFEEDPLNAVGATTSTTLRTGLASPGANDAYVRKYGVHYAIGDITNGVINNPMSDGGGVNQWQFEFEGWDAALGVWRPMAQVKDSFGASTFTDSSAFAATAVRIILNVLAGSSAALVDGDTINLTTDIDAPLVVYVSAETVDGLTWHLAESGSTYYPADADDPAGDLKYGGYRHTPVLNSTKYPYYDLTTAWAAATAAGTILEILDSETYETTSTNEITMGAAGLTLQSSLGETPTITNGRGHRTSREMNGPTGRKWHNNATTIYFNESGNDANAGTWQLPKLTAQAAVTAAGAAAQSCVYGGIGASVSGGIFVENVTLPAGLITFEPEYGRLPTIDGLVTFNSGPIRVDGWNILDGVTAAAGQDVTIYNCTVTGSAVSTGNNSDLTVFRCRVYGVWQSVIFAPSANNKTLSFLYNEVWSFSIGLYINGIGGQTHNVTISHNIFRDTTGAGGSGIGIFVNQDDITGTLSNNTFYNMIGNPNPGDGTAITGNRVGGITVTLDENIIHTTSGYGFYFGTAGTTGDYNTFYLCSSGNSNNYANPGGNDQTADPRLIDISNARLGLSADSPCLNYDAGNNDTGPELRLFYVTANTATVDGIILDCQNLMFNCIKVNNGTGSTVKWCSCLDSDGIAVDTRNTATSSHTIRNNLFDSCGVAIRTDYGGNTYQELAVYDCRRFSIYIDQVGHTLDHVSTHGGEYGLYVAASGGSVSVRNSIFSAASIYTLGGVIGYVVLYCCADGTVSSIVDTSDASNILAQPLFVNTNAGEEDLNLRTLEGGYSFESPCKDAASDGYDIGCYLIDRSVLDWTWDTYELDRKSWDASEMVVAKDPKAFMNATGDQKISATSHRRRFTLRWAPTSATPDNAYDRKVIEYISSLVQTDENDLSSEGGLIRIHFRPREYMYPGTEMTTEERCNEDFIHGTAATGDVNAADSYIEMPAGTFIRNELKGYHASFRWDHRTDGVVFAGAEVIQSLGAGWTINQWAGYWVRQGIYYFYIVSNTATQLVVSDPFQRLVDVAANFEFYIESYHKIVRNDEAFVYVDDSAGQLITCEDVEWFVDFIVCRLIRSDIDIQRQLGSRFDKPYDANPSRLELEEAGLCP